MSNARTRRVHKYASTHEGPRIFTAVYVRAGAADTMLLRAQAARLVMSEHSVLCDRTAAWIHGIHAFAREHGVTTAALDLLLRGPARPSGRGGSTGRGP